MGVVAALSTAVPAHAEWRRAESERFVVYSRGFESDLRDYVQKLETYDRVLRYSMGLPMDVVPPRKLPIYIVNSHRGLEEVWPGLGERVGGFYTYSDDDIFAVAMRDRGDDILLHEYAHHAMMQNAPFTYPAWFVEGFAEYFATAEIRPGSVEVGRHSPARTSWLTQGSWISMEDLLSKRAGEIPRSQTYYPLAWLLTHWFLSDDAHKAQLSAYLRAVGGGMDSNTALQQTTGLSPDMLERTLRSYLRGALPFTTLSYPFPRAEMTVTNLPSSADDLLLLNQRLKRPVADKDKAETIQIVHTITGRFPEDSLARLVLGRGELAAGDRARGELALTALLESEPDNVEALQLMAAARMSEAGESSDPEAAQRLQRQARGFLGRAFRADDADFTTFSRLAESRRHSQGYPDDNDLHTLELAFTLAPQLPGARMQLAAALIFRDRRDEGIALLEPLANSPHGAEIAKRAREMIAEARAGASGESAIGAAEAAGDADPDDPVTPEPAPAA